MSATYLPTDVRVRFARAMLGDSELDKFEKWIYANSDLDKYLDPNTYLELIASDFSTEDGRRHTRELIRSILEPIDPLLIGKQEVQQLLNGMLYGSIDLLTGVRELSRLHSGGLDFIPVAFVGFDSETDSIPTSDKYHLWDQDALKEKLKELNDIYRESILDECRALLSQLVKADAT
jgi:hypothetical protein